jgi:hypothetical protein
VEEALMAIVAGFDVHGAQITFDALDTESGEVMRGRIDATAAAVTGWTGRFAGQRLDVAVEACTGWLFVCDRARGCRRGCASGRAGEDAGAAGLQAAGQDRSRARALVA